MTTAKHLERTRAAMADADMDLLVLGREANARYVSGAHRLWLAGTRPFAPGCVVVRETGAVHLLSVTDDGIPAAVPLERLYPISWNPMNLIAAVAATVASNPVRRIGVDGLSPLFQQLLATAFPDAELLDGEALLRAVRRVKSPDDVAAIRAAIAVAENAAVAVRVAAAADGSPPALRGVFSEWMARLGVSTPAFEPEIRHLGDDWTLRAGVIRDGWEGSLARTWPGASPARAVVAAAVESCRPGTTVADVETLGVSVDGVGLGHEELFAADVLTADMVIVVEATVDERVHGDTVWVTDDGPVPLTTLT
jgi:creatinase/prolidase-like protein